MGHATMGLGIALVAAAAVPGGGGGGLTVSPESGTPGTDVTVSQRVSEGCGEYEVLFGGQVASDPDGDTRQVAFTVPNDASPGTDIEVIGSCSSTAEGGSAVFSVGEPATTTSESQPTSTGSDTTAPPPPPTTDGGPTTTVADVPETVEECEREAGEAAARLAYEPERRMTVGRSYEVQAALSLDELPSDVTFETSTTVTVLPDVRCEVEARLTGAGFGISPPGPQAQAFVGTRVLVWRWDVTPEEPGDDRELTLHLQSHVVEPGRTVPGPVILSETVIDVDAEPVSAWQELVDWLRDVFGHPVVPVVLAPGSIALYAAWRRRRHRREPLGHQA